MSTDLDFLLEGATTSQELPKGKTNPMPGDNEGLKDASLGEGGEGDDDLDPLEEAELLKFAITMQAMHESGLQEGTALSEQMNIVRLNKQTRLLNLTNRSAIIMAKRAGDQLYDKYAKFNALRIQFRSAIVKKYGSKASAYARKLMTKAATATAK
jgi:hypothetical protein